MPEKDGFQATRHMREVERASGKHTPIIALTANAMLDDREASMMAGMDAHLEKPIQIEELIATITHFGNV